jgi:hypothetical protein
MNKKTPIPVGAWFIFSFIGIAVIALFIQNPVQTLVFLAIAGTIVLLYKFPPQWLLSLTQTGRKPKAASKGKKRKKYPFRVIDGNKKKSS